MARDESEFFAYENKLAASLTKDQLARQVRTSHRRDLIMQPELQLGLPLPTEDEIVRAKYTAHLNSPKWPAIRAAKLAEAGGKCEWCPAPPGRREIHHRTYERLGEELLSDLVCLCPKCHSIEHGKFDAKFVPEAKPAIEVTGCPDGALEKPSPVVQQKKSHEQNASPKPTKGEPWIAWSLVMVAIAVSEVPWLCAVFLVLAWTQRKELSD